MNPGRAIDVRAVASSMPHLDRSRMHHIAALSRPPLATRRKRNARTNMSSDPMQAPRAKGRCVGDSSVFPTVGGLNPALTIQTIGLRAAARILASQGLL